MPVYCVFNQTRNSFLGLRVAQTHSVFVRLPGWSGKVDLEQHDGIWLISCTGIHTFGRSTAIDVVYLDGGNRVTRLVEHLSPSPVAIVSPPCRQILELPVRAIYGSRTEMGDQLLICRPEDLATSVSQSSLAA